MLTWDLEKLPFLNERDDGLGTIAHDGNLNFEILVYDFGQRNVVRAPPELDTFERDTQAVMT